MSSMRFLLILAMTVLFVHKGECLKCWVCADTGMVYLRGCSDPFLGSADVKEDNLFVKDLTSESNQDHIQILPNETIFTTQTVDNGLEIFCVKITGKLLGEKYVVRHFATGFPNITKSSCVPNLIGSRVQERLGGTIGTCDTCAGDLCNGAVVLGTTAVLLAPLLLLLK